MKSEQLVYCDCSGLNHSEECGWSGPRGNELAGHLVNSFQDYLSKVDLIDSVAILVNRHLVESSGDGDVMILTDSATKHKLEAAIEKACPWLYVDSTDDRFGTIVFQSEEMKNEGVTVTIRRSVFNEAPEWTGLKMEFRAP